MTRHHAADCALYHKTTHHGVQTTQKTAKDLTHPGGGKFQSRLAFPVHSAVHEIWSVDCQETH